ncbi:MAG TPA: polysaccharide export protein EpsE [Candidatus Aquabacterium excrementipullorum]|nr:polysaccharide export protein EpsE [Candidatus Aquabacterium excrementipullorum]
MKWMRNVVRALMAWMLMATLQVQAAPQGDYVLGVGDIIKVSVYQNQDLTLETRISESGVISYPLLGTVKLGGLSVADAEKKIAAGLRDGNFLKQPQVSILVTLVKGNQVSVLGAVNRPSRYPLDTTNTRLSEALAYAGGIMIGSGSDTVIVTGTRNGQPFRREIDFPLVFAATNPAEDILLQNGDTVYVDRVPQIYIYGEVQRPGPIRLERDMTVMQALAAASGLTLRGTEKGIKVNRRQPDGSMKVIQPGMNDTLQKDDVVYVKESLF